MCVPESPPPISPDPRSFFYKIPPKGGPWSVYYSKVGYTCARSRTRVHVLAWVKAQLAESPAPSKGREGHS